MCVPSTAAAAAAAEAVKEGFIEVQQINVAIMGAGGAGKTSTLAAMVGQKPPSLYTSTDVCTSATRVASVADPSEALVRAVSTDNRVLLSSSNLSWLLGDQLFHLIARGANARLVAERKEAQLPARYRCLLVLKAKLPEDIVSFVCSNSQQNAAASSASPGAVSGAKVGSGDARIKKVVKDVLLQAAELTKLSTSEPLARVSIINFIDSGGQLQFSEIFRTFNENIDGGIFVFDATKDPKANIKDQFYCNGKPLGEPYTSQCTYELLFKRSLQALQQYEKPPRFSMVMTHPDLVNPSDLPDRLAEMNEWVQGILDTTEMGEQVIYNGPLNDVLHVLRADDPSEEDTTRVRKLLQRFCDMFSDESLVPVQKIPLRQFLLEQAMRKVGEGRRGVLSLEECQQIAHEVNMPLESVDEALRYLRSCNLILYYPEVDCLKDVVFCEVQTLLSIITQLVQYSSKLRGVRELAALPAPDLDIGRNIEFATLGTVCEELLETSVFAPCFDANLTAAKFIGLMEHLEIMGRVDPHRPRFIMPCMLPEMSSENVSRCRTSGDAVQPLLLYFGKWPQSGIFCSLIARLGSLFHWKPVPSRALRPPRLYRNCMKLDPPSLACTVTLVESYDSGYFEVHVRPFSGDGYEDLCPQVKRTLCEALQKVTPKDAFICANESCVADPSERSHVAVVEGRYLRCTLTRDGCAMSAKHSCWFEKVQSHASSQQSKQLSGFYSREGSIRGNMVCY